MKIKVDFAALPRERLEDMAAAGAEVEESYRLLRKTGANVVGQVLEHQGTFYEYDHYPEGDVYDNESHSQYYYHSHREGEHGHFHTFLRVAGIPDGIEPIAYDGAPERPMGEDAIAHFVAISMNKPGYPIGLFTVNRWVSDDSWYKAEDLIALLDRFKMDHTYPCLAVNRWITAMLRLFRPQIEALILERDRVVWAYAEKHNSEDVLEDRDLELTSIATINVPKQIEAVNRALKSHRKVA